MINHVLIVCIGNICRSPVAAALLNGQVPEITVTSAGLGAVVGDNVDSVARAVAEKAGLALPQHAARQFTPEIGQQNDLILTLESSHKRKIEALAPQLAGRTFTLGRWSNRADIPDPYRRSEEFHQQVFVAIQDATLQWAKRLKRQ